MSDIVNLQRQISELNKRLRLRERENPTDAIGSGARVYNSSDITLTTAIETALTFDSERFDHNAYHSTSTNTNRLTAPTDGLYMIGGNVSFNVNTTGDRRIRIKLNGSTFIADSRTTPVSGTITSMALWTLYELAATDYVELIARQSSGGNLNVLALGNYTPEFFIYRVR